MPMWIVGLALGVIGAAAIAAVIWALPVTLRRLKPKPVSREVVASYDFVSTTITEQLRRADEAISKMQGVRPVHIQITVEREPTGPPAILCSSCGDTLERNGDRFQCGGCGREVG